MLCESLHFLHDVADSRKDSPFSCECGLDKLPLCCGILASTAPSLPGNQLLQVGSLQEDSVTCESTFALMLASQHN